MTRFGDVLIDGNEDFVLNALCGTSKHTFTTEAYFHDATYNFKNGFLNQNIIINNKGQSTNILLVIDDKQTKTKVWHCNDHCKTNDPDILKELKNLFEDIANLSSISAYEFLKKIDNCSAEITNSNRLGHSLNCFTQPLLCNSKFIKLQILYVHFPKLRTIKRHIYNMRHLFKYIEEVDKASSDSDLNALQRITALSKELCYL